MEPPQVLPVSGKQNASAASAHKPPPLDYEEPEWSKAASGSNGAWSVDVLKGGTLCEEIVLNSDEPFLVLGRLPICDIPMEHPSISRYHAVLQFRGDGALFVYDLGTTHGTRLNKKRIEPRTHVRIFNGSHLSLAESTRVLVFQCSDESQDMPQIAVVRALLPPGMKTATEAATTVASSGASWGMAEEDGPAAGDDDDDDDGEIVNPMEKIQAFKSDPNAAYQKDPMRAIKEWYGRNDMEGPEFDVTEDKEGHARTFTAALILRLPNVTRPIGVRGTAPKRRDAEVEAAREACHALEALGLLQPAAAGEMGVEEDRREIARKRRRRAMLEAAERAEEQDEYYDRTVADGAATATVGAKRRAANGVETFESLSAQLEEVDRKLVVARAELVEAEVKLAAASSGGADDEVDDLDAFMNSVEDGLKSETVEKSKLRVEELLKDHARLERLVNIARPALPELASRKTAPMKESSTVAKVSFKLEESSQVVHVPSPERVHEPSPDKQPLATMPGASESPKVTATTPSSPPPLRKPIAGPALTPAQYEAMQKAQQQKQNDAGVTPATTHDDVEFVERDEDITEWLPPSGQRGDGMTELNKKFGY